MKCDYAFKKKVVMSYLNGEGGYGYIAKLYGISYTRKSRKYSSYKGKVVP